MPKDPKIVFTTARGTRYHASRYCHRLVNAQNNAKARGFQVAAPVAVPFAELPAGRKPCDCTLVENDEAMDEAIRQLEETRQRLDATLTNLFDKVRHKVEVLEGKAMVQTHPDLAALDAELNNLYPDAR